MERIFFKSELFEIEQGEDDETNPGLYGRQLASWLRDKFDNIGYKVEEIIPEDWGWCVMCQRQPYWLWLGCSCVLDDELKEGQLPKKEDIIWHCFATVELPFFKRLFKRVDTTDALAKLKAELLDIIQNEKAIRLVDEP